MRLQNPTRILWIDAICINQESLAKRSNQVALMSTIYRLAKTSLIFLSSDEATAERGLKAVQKLVCEIDHATNSYKTPFQTLYHTDIGAACYSSEGFTEKIDFPALE
jgi:hypothetical protein